MAALGLEQRADAVTHAGCAMQLHQRRALRGAGVAIACQHGDRFLERQDVLHLRVVGQCIQETLLHRAGIAEHKIHPVGEELFDDCGTTGLYCHCLKSPWKGRLVNW